MPKSPGQAASAVRNAIMSDRTTFGLLAFAGSMSAWRTGRMRSKQIPAHLAKGPGTQ